MGTSTSSSAPSSGGFPPTSTSQMSLALILVLATLILGLLAVMRSVSVFGNSWVLKDLERILVAVAVLAPAYLACGVFSIAARLLCTTIRQPVARSRQFWTLAILVAFYGPFYWAVASRWWHLVPILPGFTAGHFTKPMDNHLAFILASCAFAVLLLLSLCTIRDRLPNGRFAAPVIALVLSSFASYAAYSLMQV